MDKLKVLLVSSEVAPFSKTGGLADVAGSLPKALAADEIDIRVVMPKVRHIPQKALKSMKSVANGYVNILFATSGFEVFSLEENGVTYYFIEHNQYFDREGYYGYGDDGERFTFFAKAVLEMLPLVRFQPDVIHTNDWQTAALNLLLKANYSYGDFYKNIRTVFSIHNMKYQGVFPKEIMDSLLGVSWEHFTYDRVEFYDQVNFMKAGIVYADAIATVSKTYVEEIKQDYYAENLGNAVRSRGNDLYGIVNGIDVDTFNPATDPKIFVNYDKNRLRGKYENKRMLQESLGLPVRSNVPLIGMITRMVTQKGIDLIGYILHEILQDDIQFVFLGAGEYRYEEMLKYYASSFPQKVSSHILYDDTLAHRIYAGADMFLMPSLFEPCGLSQMIGLRYGTVPIVRETGGLKDTVIPYNMYTGEGTGFSFSNYNAHEMKDCIHRAISVYHEREVWRELVMNGMEQDFSWNKSAREYADLYRKIVQGPGAELKPAEPVSAIAEGEPKRVRRRRVSAK